MQRIVFRYHKDHTAAALQHSDLRASFLDAARSVGLPLGEDRRNILMGPPLPAGATSETEPAVLELLEPREPSDVCRLLNTCLPDGVRIMRAWVAQPGSPDENPGAFDEAVYDVVWRDALPIDALRVAVQQFLAATEVQFTRVREKKVQQLNARAFVRDIALLAVRDRMLRLRMILSIGPQGSFRPEEVLQLLCSSCSAETVQVHRVALLRSSGRHLSPAYHERYWGRAIS